MLNKNKIKIQNLSVNYKNNKKNNNIVLQDINLDLSQGQNLSILGGNGSGKTTLLRCLTNSIPFEGDIFIDSQNIKVYNQKLLARKISMLSQVFHITFDYTIFDTVLMGRYSYNTQNIFSPLQNKHIQEKNIQIVLDSLEIVGLSSLKDRFLTTLSGGQLQRVFLAKIIAQNPDIILLDEPTNHLDIKYQIELINFFKNWSSQNNKTIIGVFHDINLSMLLTENTLLLHNKKIKSIDNINNIIKSDLLNIVYDVNIKEYMLNSLKKWDAKY